MKKILIGLLVIASISLKAQDSTKLIFSNGKAIDSTLTYISIAFEVFSTMKKTETYWTSNWKGNDKSSIIKTDYGLNLKQLWDDMLKAAKAFELKNNKGERLAITNEDDLLNEMASHGYRFLIKTAMPPLNVGMVAARAYGGTMYKFEKR